MSQPSPAPKLVRVVVRRRVDLLDLSLELGDDCRLAAAIAQRLIASGHAVAVPENTKGTAAGRAPR